ncbi:MAG: hypothetical protein Q8M16_15065 [Pirellulaceae bacterium]|nr:hypothetical protein [Pirellulaceae bacterium]
MDDSDDDEYIPTQAEIQKAAAAIQSTWTDADAELRLRYAPEPVDCPPDVRAMAQQRVTDRQAQTKRDIARDPMTWLDIRQAELSLAIRSGDFHRAKAVVEQVQAHGLDYEPPQEITVDSWIDSIFVDTQLISHLEAHGITRARHLLEIPPAVLRTITSRADEIIEVMRGHFEKPKPPTRPTPTSGVVDWSIPNEVEEIDEYEAVKVEREREREQERSGGMCRAY